MNRHVADTRPPSSEQEWIDTYNRVKAEGKIPGFPPATNQGGTPVYPQGTDTGENGLCSWTRESSRSVALNKPKPELTCTSHLSRALLRRQRHLRRAGRHVRDLVRRRRTCKNVSKHFTRPRLTFSCILFRLGARQPVPASRKLLDFLKEKNQTSTHFMIGTAIVQNPDVFAQTLANGGHIGACFIGSML